MPVQRHCRRWPRNDCRRPPSDAAGCRTKEARLDQLFADLKRERNEKAAERIAGRIWDEWFQSGSASIDLMMQWSQKAMDDQKFDVALDFLDQVVTLRRNMPKAGTGAPPCIS